MTHNHILERIAEVYRECDIRSFPIDCFSILKCYDFKIYSYSTLKQRNPRLYKMCIACSDEAFRYEKIIAYNERKGCFRIKFSLMHELGHYILEHDEQNQKNEDEADYFASNILAPRAIMYNLNCQSAEDVHTIFQISYMAANRAWYDYQHRCWTYSDKVIREQIFPPYVFPHPVKAAEIIEPELISGPATEYIPSKEFEERRRKALARIRRRRKQIEKQLKEYEEDMEFIGGFEPDVAFARAEHQWLYGNDL